MNWSNLDKIGVKQVDQSDCGVSCVLTLLNYYGITESHETIRSIIGKTSSGSTLLGLKEGLAKYGIQSDGYEAAIEQIKELKYPCILHTVFEGKYLHFIILFRYEKERFILFDPGKGLISLTESELENVWQSKRLLSIESSPIIEQSVSLSKPKERAQNIYIELLLLFKKHQNVLFTAGFLGILISVLGLSLAVFTQVLIDKLLYNVNRNGIFIGLSIVFGILLIKSVLNYGRSYLLLIQAKSFNSEIIESFFGKIMFLPLTFFESKNTGDLIARMHDSIRIQSLTTIFFGQTIINFFILLSISIFMLFHSLLIGSLVVMSAIVFVLLSSFFRKRITSYQKGAMSAYATSESVFIDTITGSEAIKSYGKEKLFTSIIKAVYVNFQSSLFNLNIFKIRVSLLLDILGVVLTISIFFLSVNQYLLKIITIGELVAILQLSLMVTSSLLQIFVSSTQVQEAATALNRMKEYTQLKREDNLDSEHQLINIDNIEVLNLTFKYPGRTVLISDISFSADKGELVLLKGQSGKGKTTIFKLLQQFYRPTTGDIIINKQKSISEFNAVELRNKIGYVPQEIKIFSGPLLFNIALTEAIEPQEVIAFCKSVGIHDAIEKFPDGYNTMVGETGIKLSGGQKQLIGLARALYKKPEILLLDEATSSMDGDLERAVQESLLKMRQSLIIIVSSHGVEWDNISSKRIDLL